MNDEPKKVIDKGGPGGGGGATPGIPPPCIHVWHFIEKKIGTDIKVTYVFHCVLCLAIITRTQR